MALNACSFYIGTHAHKKQARKHAAHTGKYTNTGLIVPLWTRAERFSDLHQAETSRVWSDTGGLALWWKEIAAKPNRDWVMDGSMPWFGRVWSLLRSSIKNPGTFALCTVRVMMKSCSTTFHPKSTLLCNLLWLTNTPESNGGMLKSHIRSSWQM